ncbi:MAG: phosphoribosyltransferase domain-containing protein [Desulfobacterales bacterium]|nr:phosphoribosyltransferase domain-containing protein [Desulfobacterales bacterium]
MKDENETKPVSDSYDLPLSDFSEGKKEFSENSKLKCFVIMPFGSRKEYSKGVKESNFVYKHIICPSIKILEKKEDVKIEVIREVDKAAAGSITKSILHNIANADICIVDITGLNPNVFFELGIRYCLREKITILIKQYETVMPFDISGFKCISYDCFEPDIAVSAIADFLISGRKGHRYVDSLVFETFPDMRVEIPDLVESVGEKRSHEGYMSWIEWWDRVIQLSRLLRDAYDNGRFVPVAVFGISNGGLMLADLLVREVFKGVPVLSLWANRLNTDKKDLDRGCYYFDNDFNKALIKTLKNNISESPTLLIVDDIVSTGATSEQASYFMKRELGGDCQILFTPLYCRSIDYLEAIRDMLPTGFKEGKIFHIDETKYFESLARGGSFLPYRKVLAGEKRPYVLQSKDK